MAGARNFEVGGLVRTRNGEYWKQYARDVLCHLQSSLGRPWRR